MKKICIIAAIIVVLAVVFVFVSNITPRSDENELESDSFYTIENERESDSFYTMDLGCFASAGVEQLLETEETLYYLCSTPGGETRLYFSDKSNKEWLPLCGKPNCLHRTEDCESVLEGNASNKVWLYGSHIYYLVRTEQSRGPELWRMKLDGSSHEKLCAPFENEKNTGAMYSYDWYFHNKYAIVLYHTLDSEKPGGQTQVYRLDLGAKELEAVRLEIPEGVSLGNPIAGCGNMLFCVCGDEDKPSLVKTDLDSGETRILFELPFMPDLYSCAFHDGGIIFAEGWEQGKIYRFDVESGLLETLASAEPETRRWYYPSGNYVFGSNSSRVSPFAGTEISDLSGNMVWESKPSDGSPEIGVGSIIGNYVLGYENGENRITIEHLPTWYLDIREIGTDSFGWHRWGND